MSVMLQVREHFNIHSDKRFDSTTLCDELDIESQSQVTNALNLMHNAGEVQRKKKETGAGYEYWLASGKGALSVKDVVARLGLERTDKPLKKPGKSKAQKEKKPKQIKRTPPPCASGGRWFCGVRDSARRPARHRQRRDRGKPVASGSAALAGLSENRFAALGLA